MNYVRTLMATAFFLSLSIIMISPIAGSSDCVNKDDVAVFLSSDTTNVFAKENDLLSSTAAYMLSDNALESGICLGCVRLYDEHPHNCYWFCYRGTCDGDVVYIDPKTDKIYTYEQATKRCKEKNLDSSEYFRYQPFAHIMGFGESPYWAQQQLEIVQFIKDDQTNIKAVEGGVSSSIAAYHLSRNASRKNISLGRVRLYDSKENRGYWFCYNETPQGYVIYIDPKTDTIYTYTQARDRRKHHDLDIGFAVYYHYYPYTHNEGFGEAPYWMKRGYGDIP